MKAYQFLLLLVCCSCGHEANYHFIKIRGKKQHVLTWGKGEPVVIFLNGGGSTLKDFNLVQKEISKTNKTISYDKPGLGKSELINSPRTLENVTEDLRILIKKEGINKTPLILVGHSMGGAVARFYLHRYPENVVGLILVDPGSEYLEDEWRKIKSAAELAKEDGLLAEQLQTLSKGFQMEVKAYRQHDSILKTIKLQTDIPITLLESNKIEEGDQDGKLLIEIQKRLYRDFQKSVSQTKLISTEVSGHFIQLEEPHLVINAINEMLVDLQYGN